jgi:hypothetical protein
MGIQKVGSSSRVKKRDLEPWFIGLYIWSVYVS